ncbi:MAG TPA: endolytic transglycosylase MltG [Aggregatilinea sp.]|uniref:endolytic transglycosylase MltG n=1 Tax=Aggregatilinea sp. TaxID=2806333 RepID=UPI002B7CC02B|nr:endolytic transglycosylase MltG [Aggregatilinea sp.]HML23883.1 endolytic transglycosylase MltG [Aggregatilinea sp.]
MNGTAVRAILLALVLGCMLVTCTAAGGLYLWARQEGLNPVKAIQLRVSLARNDDALNTPAGSDPTMRRFTVSSGDSASIIAANLLADGLITDSALFVDYVVYHRLDAELEAGTYFLQQTQTIPQIARALTDAASATIPFRTLEGWRLEEIAQVIDSNPLLDFSGADFMAVVGPGGAIPEEFKARAGIPDVLSNGREPSLEGFLYPGTYQLKPGITPEELRDEMLAAFDAHVTQEFYDEAAAQGLTMYQVVTLASIVQKEAVDLDEAPVIASVYLNRFRLPMRLDADPTVQYALGNTRDAGTWWPSITQADYYGLDGLPNQSYSTYLNEGLPPGPIAAPGLPAIRAVIQPAETQYYYFRRGCEDDNRHVFFTLDQQADHANFTCN